MSSTIRRAPTVVSPHDPLRRLYKRSHRLRRFMRRRKDAVTYQLARVGALAAAPGQLASARSRWPIGVGDLIYATLPQHAPAGARAPRHRLRRQRCRRRHASASRAPRSATRRAASSSSPSSTTSAPRFDEYVVVEGCEHWHDACASSAAAASSSPATSATGSCSAPTSRARAFPIAAIARRINDSRLNQLLVDFRARNGVRTILRESPTSSREILQVLNERGVLALLIDQDIQAPSVSVPFFGRLARTPAAAAALAVRRDLPVVPVFAQRRPEGGHRFIVMAPILPAEERRPAPRHRRADRAASAQILEDRIRQNPAEWVWWHRAGAARPIPRLDLDTEIQYPKCCFALDRRGGHSHGRQTRA